MLFGNYFYFILTRFAQKSNLINTCHRSPLGPLRRLEVNSGASSLLILLICKPFSLLTTSFFLTDTIIVIKRPNIQVLRGCLGMVEAQKKEHHQQAGHPRSFSQGRICGAQRESENLQRGMESKGETKYRASPGCYVFLPWILFSLKGQHCAWPGTCTGRQCPLLQFMAGHSFSPG